MPIVMQMHWPEVTKAQYDEARKKVHWEDDVPKGAKYHVAWFADDGFRVIDVWDTAPDFERFVQTRLMPEVQRIGIQGQPKIQINEVHSIFAPNPA